MVRWVGQGWQVLSNHIDDSVGINQELFADINGSQQWLLLRGEDRTKPLLLFVHGGPGVPMSISANLEFSRDLEEDFVVVHWDQRFAGHSFTGIGPDDSLTIAQQLSDLDSITDTLLEKFERNQLYLVAHSWGTVASILATQHFPEKIAGFISVCQVVNMEQNENASHAFLKSEVQQRGSSWLSQKLEEIGPPPYGYDLKNIVFVKAVLQAHGGILRRSSSAFNRALGIFWNPHYDLIDLIKVGAGFFSTLSMLLGEFHGVQFDQTIKEIKVPVAFILGRHDYMTPSKIAEAFFYGLQAPAKELHWFETAAHFPYFEDPKAFASIIRRFAKEHPANDS